MANHRNNVFATTIKRQQGSEKLPTYYVLINHVKNVNRNNNKNNFQRGGRAELTTTRAKMMSLWK